MNAEITFLAAMVAGLVGSGHCLAMCGGMAGLLSAKRHHEKPVRQTLAYNFGRIASYGIAGLLAGTLGRGVGMAADFNIAAGQLRIISGAIIVLAGIYLLTGKRIFAPLEKIGERFWARISPLAVKTLNRQGGLSVIMLGMLWGWLPCGLTWSMLAAAAATADPFTGLGLMTAFGLGTLPAMLAAGLAGFKLRGWLNKASIKRGAAVFMIAAGVWTAAFPIIGSHAGHAPDEPAAHGEHAQHH